MSTTPATITTAFSEVIANALAFPMDDVVERYAKDYGISVGVAKEYEIELKKYLALCAVNPSQRYGMSRVIDDLWHTFICFTVKYHRFCNHIAGWYIHHEPATEEEKRNGEARNAYLLTLEEYQRRFGNPPVHVWPRPGVNGAAETTCSGCTACGGSGCDASGCTQCRG